MQEEKNITVNRKARHDYFIEETYEAGIVLLGTEVKSLRENKASLIDAYATVKGGEVWLLNAHISPFEKGNIFNHPPRRPRKLLLNKQEIRRLIGRVSEKGFTLIPLRMYFHRGIAKVEIALARGKRTFDKREAIAKKEAKREVERALRRR